MSIIYGHLSCVHILVTRTRTFMNINGHIIYVIDPNTVVFLPGSSEGIFSGEEATRQTDLKNPQHIHTLQGDASTVFAGTILD